MPCYSTQFKVVSGFLLTVVQNWRYRNCKLTIQHAWVTLYYRKQQIKYTTGSWGMLLYLDRSDERKGIFFFHEERGRVISLGDMMMWVLDNFFTYLNGLSRLFIFMYLFVALFTFIRELSFNLNWLRVSAVDSIGILAWSPPASSRSSPASPLPPSPRLLLRFTEAPDILTMYVDLQGRFWGCCYSILLLR